MQGGREVLRAMRNEAAGLIFEQNEGEEIYEMSELRRRTAA